MNANKQQEETTQQPSPSIPLRRDMKGLRQDHATLAGIIQVIMADKVLASQIAHAWAGENGYYITSVADFNAVMKAHER